MKAFLLAAGEGTRLRPITNAIPKCLVPIAGQPLLSWWLQLCARHNIDEVLLNLHAHADAVRQFIATHDFGVRVHLSYEPTLLGSAGTLYANRHWVEAEPYFCVLYADVLTNMDLSALRDFHLCAGLAATLCVYEVADPTRCGIAQVDEQDVIRRFVEKPKAYIGNLAFSGVMIAGPEFLAALPSAVPADLGFHVIPRLQNRMTAYRTESYLLDIGTLPNYELAQRTWPGSRPIRQEEEAHADRRDL